MFSKLEIEHSLYEIEMTKLQEFKDLAKEFESPTLSILDDERVHSKLDNYAIVLNNWLFLQENYENIYFKPDKMMPYASNFYIIEQLRKNPALTRYLDKVSFNKKYEFEFAYFLSEQLLIWVYDVLKTNQSTQVIMHDNKERDYFKLLDEQDISMDPTHHIYLEQKYVTQYLAHNISTTDDISNVVLKAIKNMRKYTIVKQ